MFLWLFLAFTLIPVVEIYLFITIGGVIGTFETIAIVIFTGVLGAYLTHREGFNVLRRLQLQLSMGNLPTDEFLDGAMVLVGGALLVTPGFLTDVVGFVLVIAPLRNTLRRLLRNYMRRKLQRGDMRFSRGDF